jgi:hypothetical protein
VTDNLKAGALAADKLVEVLKAANKEPKGKIGMISAYAGNEVLVNRDQGFSKRLKEIAPDLQILPVRYIDNDIQKAMSSASDLLLANSDLLGFLVDLLYLLAAEVRRLCVFVEVYMSFIILIFCFRLLLYYSIDVYVSFLVV